MSKNKKPFKSFTATSPEMEEAMKELVRSEKFIVISEYTGEHNGKIGILSNINHVTGGPANTAQLLTDWAKVMQEKADHQDQLREILGKSGIEGI